VGTFPGKRGGEVEQSFGKGKRHLPSVKEKKGAILTEGKKKGGSRRDSLGCLFAGALPRRQKKGGKKKGSTSPGLERGRESAVGAIDGNFLGMSTRKRSSSSGGGKGDRHLSLETEKKEGKNK